MKFGTCLFFLTTMMLTVACSPPQTNKSDANEKPADKASSSVDTAAIRAAGQGRLEALSKKDIDGYLAAYAEDAIWIPPGAAEIVGKAAARQRIGNALTDTAIDVQLKTDEQQVLSPEWVLGRGSYLISKTPKAGKPAVEGGSYLTIWHKEGNSGWKIAYDVWNSERPAAGK